MQYEFDLADDTQYAFDLAAGRAADDEAEASHSPAEPADQPAPAPAIVPAGRGGDGAPA